jgi:hypothetical protein
MSRRGAPKAKRSRSAALASGAVGAVLLVASAWILRELSASAYGVTVGLLLATWGLGAVAWALALLLGMLRPE